MKKQDLFLVGTVIFFIVLISDALTYLLVADTCPRPKGCLFSNLDCGMDPGSANIALALQEYCPMDLAFWGALLATPLLLAIICAIAYYNEKKENTN